MKFLLCLIVVTIAVDSAVIEPTITQLKLGISVMKIRPGRKEERNKQAVIQMMQDALGDKDFSALDKYIDADPKKYIQHNPLVPDGREALKEMFIGVKLDQMPKIKLEVQRVAADGDFVFYHWKSTQIFGKVNSIVEIFSFKNDKIAEHWDLIQPYPEESNIDHTLF